MRRFAISTPPIIMVLLVAALALAEESPGGGDDTEAVQESTASFVAAFNKGDAEAVAAHWTPDGDLVTVTGELVKGRDAIRGPKRVLLKIVFPDPVGERLQHTLNP